MGPETGADTGLVLIDRCEACSVGGGSIDHIEGSCGHGRPLMISPSMLIFPLSESSEVVLRMPTFDLPERELVDGWVWCIRCQQPHAEPHDGSDLGCKPADWRKLWSEVGQ